MRSIRRILVGLDLEEAPPHCSPATLEAVRRSLWLADRLRAEVTFLTVTGGPSSPETVPTEARPAEGSGWAELLAQWRAQAEEVQIAVNFLEVGGRPAEALARHAREGLFDLIVVGTGKNHPIRRWLFGSTATQLLQQAPCSIWVTHPTDPEQVETILAADDFSEPALQVLSNSVKLAQLLDARLLALHAVVPTREDDLVSEEELPRRREIQKDLAREILVRRLAQTDYRTLQQGSQLCVEKGPVEHVILKAVDSYSVDLVMLACRHRNGVETAPPQGGTLDKLLQKLPCSLLVWKS
jgi:nucleotide-binding universal stress UspA family protein